MKLRLIGLVIALAAGNLASAQESAPEDGVIGSCMAKGNSIQVCICASLVLNAHIGDEDYARFGEIEDRLAALTAGAEEHEEGEEMALLSEGYQHFIPHGQAIGVCTKKIATNG